MKKQMFSVLDTKSGIFSSPFCSVNVATALRDFHRASLDPNSDISVFPTDYSLIHFAEFDDATGQVEMFSVPNNLGPATQFRQSQE